MAGIQTGSSHQEWKQTELPFCRQFRRSLELRKGQPFQTIHSKRLLIGMMLFHCKILQCLCQMHSSEKSDPPSYTRPEKIYNGGNSPRSD